jgi:hypothetical protein
MQFPTKAQFTCLELLKNVLGVNEDESKVMDKNVERLQKVCPLVTSHQPPQLLILAPHSLVEIIFFHLKK